MNSLIIALLIITLLTAIYALLVIKRFNKFEKSKNKAVINVIRSTIEDDIYRQEAKIMMDSHNFVDSTKLLIKYASKSPFNNDVPNSSFLEEMGINASVIPLEDNTAFCMMPFNKSFNKTYNAIKDGCETKGIQCHRSDEKFETGNLLRQIIISIIKSRFVFAVLDGRNPNVFYEIGLSHAIGKPVFLLAQANEKDNLPFDVASSRLFLYKSERHLKEIIEKIISEYSEEKIEDHDAGKA